MTKQQIGTLCFLLFAIGAAIMTHLKCEQEILCMLVCYLFFAGPLSVLLLNCYRTKYQIKYVEEPHILQSYFVCSLVVPVALGMWLADGFSE